MAHYLELLRAECLKCLATPKDSPVNQGLLNNLVLLANLLLALDSKA